MGEAARGPMTAGQAEAEGYARYNEVPHLVVDVPDGNFTITARTTDGRRLTVSFLPGAPGGAANMADVVYHDRGSTRLNGRHVLPTFDHVAFGRGGRLLDDTRPLEGPEKPGIVTVLMDRAPAGEGVEAVPARARGGARAR